MIVTLDIPDEIAAEFTASGREISRFAIEALALEAYRRGPLPQLHVGLLLGLSRIETEDFLAQHVVLYDYSIEELEAEADALRRLRLRNEQLTSDKDSQIRVESD